MFRKITSYLQRALRELQSSLEERLNRAPSTECVEAADMRSAPFGEVTARPEVHVLPCSLGIQCSRVCDNAVPAQLVWVLLLVASFISVVAISGSVYL